MISQNLTFLTKYNNMIDNNQDNKFMVNSKNIVFICIMVCFLQSARSQVQNCENPQYIIPYQPLDSAFDQGIDAIRGKDQLTTLIQNPDPENAKTYLLSLAPFSAPLFAMAGITLAIFIATIIQVICFNSCSKECCGNQLNSTTYNVCCFRAMVAFFLIFCFLTVAISIAALILNSDFQKAIDYTQCNTQNIVYQSYNGNNNPSAPWSGVNNFQTSINLFSVAIQNNIPFLLTYFSSSNPSYTTITSTAANSLYANSQIFNCQNSASAVVCPFPASGTTTCPSPYQAQFNSQFCNQTFKGSASNLVASEMLKNSSSWQTNTVAIESALSTINTSPQQVSALVNSVSSFTTSVTTYQTAIEQGFNQLDIVQGGITIAFYVYYSFTLALGLLGMTALCMAYFCNAFKCRYAMYFLWYLFFLMTILLFVDSGLFLGGSVAFQDGCLAYPYYFNNLTNFNKLSFSTGNQAGSVFKTCFFGANANSKSIFSGFNDTTILAQFGSLYSKYQAAIPSSSFSSVVTTIQSQLVSYAANPNTVIIEGATNSTQPQAALNQMNLFANFSLPGTTQSCRLTKDYVTYDVINCNLYLTNQPVGSNTCVVLAASNLNTIVTQRVTAFNDKGCATDANTYQERINALSAYGNSIASIAFQLAPIQQTTPPTPLQAYQNNYYGYYSSVLNFYNSDIQQIFNGFFNPYNNLQAGSNCGFVTSSMNGIVNIACNQLQAYISSYSVLNIIQSCFLFILFLLAYFLTTRLEFYEYLQGNFANFGNINAVKIENLQAKYELQSTGRNVELLTVNNSQL